MCLIDTYVEIRSTGGIVYRGVVRSVADGGELGELFELGSPADPGYRRFVYVGDRDAQIQKVDPG